MKPALAAGVVEVVSATFTLFLFCHSIASESAPAPPLLIFLLHMHVCLFPCLVGHVTAILCCHLRRIHITQGRVPAMYMVKYDIYWDWSPFQHGRAGAPGLGSPLGTAPSAARWC